MTLYPDGNGGFDASGAASKGGVPIGAIVGAVVGSLLFLVFVILFVILFLRRRRRAAALAEALENARAVPMESGNGKSGFPSILLLNIFLIDISRGTCRSSSQYFPQD
jgi:hypothetical protein